MAPQAQPRQPIRRVTTKPVFTKAQLGQALIVEVFHRNSLRVAGLLAQGADPKARDRNGTPVLLYAVAAKGNGPVVKV